MSRLISSLPTSELSNLDFVDLDLEEMSTLAGGVSASLPETSAEVEVGSEIYLTVGE